MEDYQAKAKKADSSTPADGSKPVKDVKKVITGEVVGKPKRGVGSKIHDLFIAADVKSVGNYIVMDVLIPAAKNMAVDATRNGIERLIYGARDPRRAGTMPGSGSRFSYNSVGRSYPYGSDPRSAPPVEIGPRRSARSMQQRADYILETRADAESVMEEMQAVIDQHEVVTVADVHEMIGLPHSHVDNKWGWINLVGASARQIREGYLLDLPLPEQIVS